MLRLGDGWIVLRLGGPWLAGILQSLLRSSNPCCGSQESVLHWSNQQIQEFKNRLDEQGEDQILENAEMGAYGKGYGLKLAEEHLQYLEAVKADARHQAEVAQRALNAVLAEEANAIARDANTWARWALFISLLAIIIAIAT